MSFFKEFKEFAMKGNVIDMAVGTIIGGAFGNITKSMIDDIIMPPIGLIIGGIDFKDISIHLNDKTAIKLGNFITVAINFTIMAFVIFLMVKAINKLKKVPPPAPPATPPEPTKEEVLLTEIRDALRAMKN